MTFLYFAYGSNMLIERLRSRCNSTQFFGTAIALNYVLSFEKFSTKDGSGKATIIHQDGGVTPGVIFQINNIDQEILDREEGFKSAKPSDPERYGRHDNFRIQTIETNEVVFAMTYLANNPQKGLKPYDWYLALVVAGAEQHKIDPDYVETLRETEYDIDTKKNRKNRLDALESMKLSGHDDYQKILRAQS